MRKLLVPVFLLTVLACSEVATPTSLSPSGDAGLGEDAPIVTDSDATGFAPDTVEPGAEDAGSADAQAPAPVDSGTGALDPFSFFATSLRAMQEVSGSEQGFGGDLRFGESGPGSGLRGADKICATIAERSMAGSSAKQWRAFLSATADENGYQVNAIDRIGDGPWYDRLGRILAQNKADLLHDRPVGADPAIINDFPNEDGVPNHAPDPTAGQVDNHDFLTGTNASGQLYSATATCRDWTSAQGDRASEGRPRVGHSWPRFGGPGGHGGPGPGPGNVNSASWLSALDESGCAPGVAIIERGPPLDTEVTVGSGGGYGGIYCFALSP